MAYNHGTAVPSRILVPLDGSEIGEQALPHAILLAEALDGVLVLARVPETMIVPVMSAGVWITREIQSHEAIEQAEHYLAETAGREALQHLVVDMVTPEPPVAGGLLTAIEETAADVVVMTTHGHSGIGRWVFGSIADKMVDAAPTPVYLVPAQQTKPVAPKLERLIVPLDGSPLAEAAMATAAALAQATGASLTLLRVPTVPGRAGALAKAAWLPDLLKQTTIEAETYLARQASALADAGLEVSAEVEPIVSGGVAEAILSHARQQRADCIVMSSHGRSGIGRWVFGSVADRVLRACQVPVWLVRAGSPRAVA